jgi:beta-phosphoglucomutase-like phosphatase (HAD superfamily)
LIKAVIFDIDGTLVDSVDLHAKAWQEAFAHFGHEVAFEEVRSQIGKGGDQLMPVFLSKKEIDRRGPEIEEYRSDLFKERYLPQVRAFPVVRALIKRIILNGQRIALGSSAKGDELSTYKKIAGIEDLIDEETSSDDASRSKPHPDIFEAASRNLAWRRTRLSSSGIRLTIRRLPENWVCARSQCCAVDSPKRICARQAASRSTATRPIC